MIAPRLAVLAGFVWSCLCSSPAAHADPQAKLVVIMGAEHATGVMKEAVSHVRGELAAAGLSTILKPSPSGAFDWRVALEQAARQYDAVAAIGIAAEGAGELWVHDRSVGRTVVQSVQRPGESTADLAPVVAVRSVEFVRANLASLDLSRGTQGAAKAPSLPLSAPHSGFGIGVGIHWLDATGSVSPALAGVLSAVWASNTPWVVELRASGLGPQVEYAAAAGRAQVQHFLVSSQAVYRFMQRPHFDMGVVGGAGLYRGRVSGKTTSALFTDRAMDRWAASVELGGVAWLWLSTRVCVRLDVTALATLSPVVLRIGDDEVGRMASPALLGTVSALAVF